MTCPAQRLKVTVLIGAAVCFWGYMVNGGCRDRLALPQALLTNVSVTLQNASADNIPLTAVAALVPALPALVLLPAFVAMCFAVARAICCSLAATELSACARDG